MSDPSSGPRWEGRWPYASDARTRKSDRSILPTKLPNKAGQPAAEAVEGRDLTKENADQRNTLQTQSWENGVPNGLDRVRQA